MLHQNKNRQRKLAATQNRDFASIQGLISTMKQVISPVIGSTMGMV